MKRRIDPIGKKYGKLLVLEEVSVPFNCSKEFRSSILKLRCQCDCGNIVTAFKTNIIRGKTTKCRNCQNCNINIGEKKGTLTILSRILDGQSKKYLCRCDCGFEDRYSSRFLSHGKKISCKKCRFPKRYVPKIPKKSREQAIIDTNFDKHLKAKTRLIGQKKGRLKIIAFSHWEQKENRRRAYYRARCKCGNETIIRDLSLVNSCGCLQKEKILKAENQVHARLTNSEVKAIRKMKESNIGYTGRQLAKLFQVHETIISSILLNKTYKEIDKEKK